MDNHKQIDLHKRNHLFCLSFKEHIRTFMIHHRLVDPDKKLALAVSGGVDSVVLLDVLSSFIPQLEVIHFNHGTRPEENAYEENLVREYAFKKELKIHVFHFEMPLNQRNFEALARQRRKNIFHDFISKNYWIYTAHHIDDSFEWSLMQSFKQANFKSTPGVPLFNHGVLRPFMSVTKKQILRYARAKNLIWINDQSNLNLRFERNFFRLHISSSIKARYPQVLKHYVSRQNQIARLHNLHRNPASAELEVIKDEVGGVVLISKDFSYYKAEIKEWIHHFSSNHRGEIDHEVLKLISSHAELVKIPSAFPFKGPMNFSGGVSAYLVGNSLFICGKNAQVSYKNFDHLIVTRLKNMAQIPEVGVILRFPGLIISKRRIQKKSSKFIHPLLPKTISWLKNQGIAYAYAPLLLKNHRQMLTEGAVILDSSLEETIE